MIHFLRWVVGGKGLKISFRMFIDWTGYERKDNDLDAKRLEQGHDTAQADILENHKGD